MTAHRSRYDGAPLTVVPAAPASSANSQRSAGAPTDPDPKAWLAWLADQPNLHDAIGEAFKAGVASSIVAYSVGQWERNNRADQLAERAAAILATWGH